MATGNIDAFQNGSIIKICLSRFMTYQSCEFVFGPHMNMIAGPNGNGKSAVVCALVLCLGGAHSIIGRGKDLHSYIKNDEADASIETVLKNKASPKKKTRIERRLFRNKTAEYYIDGIKSTYNDVSTLVKRLNIHLDNLCQLLPQEKVSEFARLTPYERILETQRAILPAAFSQHQRLLELDKERSILEDSLGSFQARCDAMEKELERSSPQIARLQEYQNAEKRLVLLQLKRPLAEYREIACIHESLVEKKNILETRLSTLLEPFNGLKQILAEKTKACDVAGAETECERRGIFEAEALIRDWAVLLEKKEEECEEIRGRVLAIKRKKDSTRQENGLLLLDIKELEPKIATPPEKPVDLHDEEYFRMSRELNVLSEKEASLVSDQKSIEKTGHEINFEINELKRRMADGGMRREKLELLGRISEPTLKAFNWLCANKGLFRQNVYGPACIELGVSDPFYADVLESILSRANLLSFFCLCEEDYQTFLKHTTDKNGWIVNVIYCMATDTPAERIDASALDTLGFECFANDILTGPKEVIAAICEASKIQNIPLGRVYKSAESLKKIEANEKIKRFCIGNIFYDIKRAASGLVATRTINAKRARFLSTSQGHDAQARIEALKAQVSQNKTRYEELLKARKAFQPEILEIQKEMVRLQESKTALQDIHRAYSKAIRSIQLKKERLVANKALMKTLEHDLRETRALFVDSVKHRFTSAVKLTPNIARLDEQAVALRKSELGLVSGHIEQKKTREELEARAGAFKEEQRLLEETVSAETTLRERLGVLLLKKEALVVDDMQTAELVKLPDTTKEIDIEIQRETIKKGNIGERDVKILEEHEEKKRKLETMRMAREGRRPLLAEKTAEIDTIRGDWEKTLDDAVATISDRFGDLLKAIGYTGNVVLIKDTGFEWKLDIRVKFRDGEKLHSLSLYRQSGGERSVSTITYLLALHNMFHLPFRIVDEINQGMDPRNERKVYDILNTHTATEQSQFILITPNLLSDLPYSKTTRVIIICKGKHCVVNGERRKRQLRLDTFIAQKPRSSLA
eukprot:GHVN01086821.1.p2 GENE.GHVN01086821.1~~GHVN01086821.1.p2  ORF type:complete len:1042 (-),score=113.96 GHVN01086821.1:3336-6461(-)